MAAVRAQRERRRHRVVFHVGVALAAVVGSLVAQTSPPPQDRASNETPERDPLKLASGVRALYDDICRGGLDPDRGREELKRLAPVTALPLPEFADIQVVYALCAADIETDPERRVAILSDALRRVGTSADPALRLRLAFMVAQNHHWLGAPMNAEAVLEDVIGGVGQQERREPSVRAELVEAELLLATTHIYLGRNREALDLLAAIEAEVSGDVALTCRVLGLRGQAYVHLGVPDVAATYLQQTMEAIEAHRKGGAGTELDVLHQEVVLLDMSLMLAADRSDRVLRLADRVLAPGFYNEIDATTRAEIEVRRGLALTEIARDDPGRSAEALASLQASLPDVDGESWIAAQEAIADLEIKSGSLASAASRLDDVRHRFDERIGQELTGLRLERWAQLMALTAEVKLQTGVPESDLAETESELRDAYEGLLLDWQRSVWRQEGVPFLHFGARCLAISQLMRVIQLRRPGEEGERECFQLILRAQELATVTRSRNGEAPTVEEIREHLLSRGEVLVTYFVAPERIHIFVLDAEDLELISVPARSAALARMARDFRSLVSRSPRSEGSDALRAKRTRDIDRLGEELLDLLLPPSLRPRIEAARSLSIVGSEMVAHVPFEALPWRGSRIGRKVAISYQPSIPFGVAAVRSRASADVAGSLGVDLVSVMAPTHAADTRAGWPELIPIELSRKDVRSLVGAYPCDRTVVLRGPDARWSAALSAMEREPTVLQIITHGIEDVMRERPSGLAMAVDDQRPHGFVWYEDLAAMAAPPVVVLAACGAAQGPVRRGDDRVSRLDAAFLRAGADVVVLPSAEVEINSTFSLLREFHRRLRQRGESAAEAMRYAREQVARDRVDPYYDCLIHVTGTGNVTWFEPQPEEPPANRTRWILIAAAVVALVVGLGMSPLGRSVLRSAGRRGGHPRRSSS